MKDLAELTGTLADLVVNPAFINDPKWQARVAKAMEPLDIESRVRSQLYTAARKELDTAAMTQFRRTKEIKAVTEADIKALFDEKWDDYLAKQADKKAKAAAISKAS